MAAAVGMLGIASCGGGGEGDSPKKPTADAGSDAQPPTCVAGEFRCVGDALETCASDTTKFQPVATCQAGLCDAVGKQCDNCQAGVGACESTGSSYKACDPTGQIQETTSCLGSTPFCVDKAGKPSCVACKTASDCAPSTNECELASCSADGACGLSPVAKSAPCGAAGAGGSCNGTGACVYCTPGEKRCAGLVPETCDSKGQWGAAAACVGADPLCLAGACVQCAVAGDCTPSSNECLSAVCATNKCGYSPKAQGTACLNSTGTCNGAGQCNVCQPGTKVCNGNVPLLCGSSGQYTAQPACSGATAECDPATGVCVQCTSLAQCPTSTNPCLSAVCSTNLCGFAPKPSGTTCPGGTCSAAGVCQACTPGTKTCSANSVLVCNAQGQYDAPAPCTGGTPVCLNGNCQAGSVCGNGAVEGAEQCDDSNAAKCDGCEDCERRRWLNVPSKAYAAVPGLAAKLPSNSENACYEAWVKTNGTVGDAIYLAATADPVHSNFILRCMNGAQLQFAVENGAGTALAVQPFVACGNNAWHHIAGCRTVAGTQVTLRLFWDGALVGTANGATSQIAPPSTTYVGGVAYGQDGLGGSVDEIRISNTLRYTGVFTPVRRHTLDANTVALFHLDEGAGTTATDSSPNALTGSLTGTNWAVDTGYTSTMCQ